MESEPGTATVATPGSTTVPAALLTEILRKTGKAEIAFKSDERFATLTANRSRFSVNEPSPGRLPDDVRNQGRPRDHFELWPKQMQRILADVGFAISTEETRYYLNGVYLHGVEAEGFGRRETRRRRDRRPPPVPPRSSRSRATSTA